VRELAFAYERRIVLRCPALTLAPAVCTAFVGSNGSGKTTLLKLLNGLLGPFHGSIFFDGQPLLSCRSLRRRTVYVHQHPVLFAGTVRSNMAYALKLKGFGGSELADRVQAGAEHFGLAALLEREASRLSGGETQRVALARAIAAGADVLLLDEPTAAMDQASEAAVRELLLRLRQEGLTIIFSAHDQALVEELADRVCYFENGIVLDTVATGAN
jgi:tungstate transport system ATP-binding protein